MPLQLVRPLVFFDLETTGTNVSTDRIVEIAMIRVEPDGREEEWCTLINPEYPISPSASEVHGITDADVADAPKFSDVAGKVLSLLDGADIAGYNSTQFDIPLLVEELERVGRPLDLEGRSLLDAMTIFRKQEPRTLTAAYKKYCDKDLEGAHGAIADTRATKEVLFAQVDAYSSLPNDVAGLGEYCRGSDNVDLAGRLAYDASGEVVYKFGKYKGLRVKDVFRRDPSYLDWIMRSDFPMLTKRKLQALYEEYNRSSH